MIWIKYVNKVSGVIINYLTGDKPDTIPVVNTGE